MVLLKAQTNICVNKNHLSILITQLNIKKYFKISCVAISNLSLRKVKKKYLTKYFDFMFFPYYLVIVIFTARNEIA